MKKVLIAVAVLALLAWVISWFRVPEVVATSAARPWPGGMGRLDSVAARVPPLQANQASVKLIALADALPKNEAVDEFVAREIARGELAIGGDDGTQERRTAQMVVARALVATALARARTNDPP